MDGKIRIFITLLLVANAQWSFILSNWPQIRQLEAMASEPAHNVQEDYLASVRNGDGACERGFLSAGCPGFETVATGASMYPNPETIVLPSIGKNAPVMSDSADVESDLNRGVVLLKSKAGDGSEKRSTFIFGHSSSATEGPYQYVFTRLPRLKAWDVASLEYGDRSRVYRFVRGKVVSPKDLGPMDGSENSLYLVTCYPFLTSLKRYVAEFELESEIPKKRTGG